MKGFLTSLAAVTWIGLVIWQMDRSTRKLQYIAREQINRQLRVEAAAAAHDEHGANGFSQDDIDQANQAHTTGRIWCPIHGTTCDRARIAKQTGLSQTYDAVARRARGAVEYERLLNGSH